MRIALVSEYFPATDAAELTGGVEARAYYMARELAAHHDITVVTSWREPMPRTDMIAGVNVLRVGPAHPYDNRGQVMSRLRFGHAAAEAIRAIGSADVVDALNFTVYPVAYKAARSIGAAAVATWHEVWLGRWVRHKGLITGTLGATWERRALRMKWDAIVAVSEATRHRLIEHRVPPQRIHVVYNGVDLGLVASLAPPPRVSHDLIAVGRMIESKRLDLLIDAIDRLAPQHPDLHCHLVGDGPERAKLEAAAARFGVADRFTFHGRIDAHADVLRRIAAAGLLVQCSTMEGFGMVLVEANAVGTPCLASDIPPHREVLGALGGNALVRALDVGALANHIAAHLTDAPIPPGDAGAFDWSRLAEQTVDVYRAASRH